MISEPYRILVALAARGDEKPVIDQAIFFKETQPNDDSTSAITQRDSDRWALGGNQSAFTHNFGDFEGFLVTCNVPSTNSNPVDDDNMGSGVGSMWVNPTTEGIYVRVV